MGDRQGRADQPARQRRPGSGPGTAGRTRRRLQRRSPVLSSYSFSALGSAGGAELLGGTERTRRDLILIRVLPPGLFPQDRVCDLRERPTAGDRWRPLRTARFRWRVDQTWTRTTVGGPHTGTARHSRLGALVLRDQRQDRARQRRSEVPLVRGRARGGSGADPPRAPICSRSPPGPPPSRAWCVFVR